jgi:hypothetical protein
MSLYVLCIDLAAAMNEQRKQILSWLQYLHSILCNHNTTYSDSNSNNNTLTSESKWKVIIVGTRSDLQQPSTVGRLTNTTPYQLKFPAIPLIDKLFHISTFDDPSSVELLLAEIQHQCATLLDQHCKMIPNSYKVLLHEVTAINSPNNIISIPLFKETSSNKQWKQNPDLMMRALRHLHAIGRIVLFGDQRICTNPSSISQLMAKFICPMEVRDSLLCQSDEEQVNLLTKTDISSILGVNARCVVVRFYVCCLFVTFGSETLKGPQ